VLGGELQELLSFEQDIAAKKADIALLEAIQKEYFV
jgi:hypothetical protein